MNQCDSCSSAFLSPRPNAESIGLAYLNYFTHDDIPDVSKLSFIKKNKRMLANGYRNFRFGTNDQPASPLGILAAYLTPNGRAVLDSSMRHLPKPQAGSRLLDVGCGNSTFMLQAQSAGWDVVGIDFDEGVVEAARRQGFEVILGSAGALGLEGELFDVITLSHVIEHVHEPVKLLEECYRLLKPGGFIWLETPNIESEGYRIFGADWRGLEIPRHLFVFSFESMYQSLDSAGFKQIEQQPYRPMCEKIFVASLQILGKRDPEAKVFSEFSNNLPALVENAEKEAKLNPRHREFITVKAWKP